LRKLVIRQRLKNQEVEGVTKQSLTYLKARVSPAKPKDAFGEPTQANNNWNVAIRFDNRGGGS